MPRISRWLPFAALFALSAVSPAPPPKSRGPRTAPSCPFRPLRRRASPRRRLQDSTHQRRAEPSHLPKDAPNILIILLDDVGFGLPDTYRRPDPHADADAHREPGHQLQRVPHHLDLLADARSAADRAQPSARRLRHHRRARGGLGRLYRRDPADLRHPRQGAGRLRIQDRRLRQVAQHARDRDHGDGAVHPAGRPARASASTTSTAFSPARPRNGSPGWSRTSIRSSRRTTRNTT